ncbi:ATPase assembly factor ATP10 [Dimargaris cristalligena]|uniref:ATPase assembly factor ATP10 n=1 Tax=Dimargaris cristalligena TaxID=215637 RepID=A0A4P9ZTE0_9FUNG|nr:ATPase assembly factor ATP10 [Dimargaris cristalligena]|eukprot:RKP36735.1 ATPase assembly factor ATP10 [Dimargaris cristalligena]
MSANREVALSIRSISKALKERRQNFQSGQPLGQPDPPQPLEVKSPFQTLVARLKSSWDQDATLERRKYLVDKFQRPHYQYMTELKRLGGKLFAAPTALVPADQAKYLPNLAVRDGHGKRAELKDLAQGKVRSVSAPTTGAPTPAAAADATPATVGDARVQHLRVHVIENALKAAVLRPFLRSMARHVTPDDRARFLFHFRPIDRIKDELFMDNMAMGWVFLVDPQWRIRWYANGEPKPEEVERLLAMTSQLVKEMPQA